MTSQNKYNEFPLPSKMTEILKSIITSKLEMIETYLIHAKENAYTDHNEAQNYIDDALAELKRLKERL